MKTLSAKVKISGLTLVEVLLIVCLIALLAIFLIPVNPPLKQRATMAVCMSNQKQIVLGFTMWKDDHDGKFPWEVPGTNNGTRESSEQGDAAPNYSALLAYVHQPRIFVCPTDTARTVATNQALVLNQNVSYFTALDTITNEAAGILTGDRHLKGDGVPVKPGLFVHSNNLAMDWTLELHGKVQNAPLGVMSFQDGHVAAVHGTNTDFVFQNEGLTTSRFAVP